MVRGKRTRTAERSDRKETAIVPSGTRVALRQSVCTPPQGLHPKSLHHRPIRCLSGHDALDHPPAPDLFIFQTRVPGTSSQRRNLPKHGAAVISPPPIEPGPSSPLCSAQTHPTLMVGLIRLAPSSSSTSDLGSRPPLLQIPA